MEITQERRLVSEIPGPRSRAMLDRRSGAVPGAVYGTVPIFVQAAAGAIVRDVDGNQLIDLAAGLAVLNVGNAQPAVVEAIVEQARRYTHTCMHVTLAEPYVALAERLNALAPGDVPRRTMFVNSGAEAVENAVKIARRATGRQGVAVFDHAFHGRTLLTMTMTAKAEPYKLGFGPFAPEVYRLPMCYPYRSPDGPDCGPACAEAAIELIERQIGPEQLACLVIEPVQGEGGFIVPADGFVPRLAAYCRQNGIVFVADEVQAGVGRTGRLFAIEHEDVVPDLITMAKSLASGLPLGAVVGRADLMDAVHPGGLGGTFGGNPLSCAAGLAVLDVIESEGLLERADRVGRIVSERLREAAESCDLIGDVRGRGAMVAAELVRDRRTKEPAPEATARVIEESYKQGVIVLKAGTYDNVLRLLPPLSIDESLLAEGMDVVRKALEAVGTTG